MKVVTFFYFLNIICAVKMEGNDRYLKQVLILSRHGLRSPLSKELMQMTPKKWPTWKEKPGYLTSKGAMLEGLMGKFFALWFEKEGLITSSCPSSEVFYVYANTKQRTLASASAFVQNAFPDCNITINHSRNKVDPIFNPVIHNTSSTFIHMAKEKMQDVLNQLNLNSSYEYLDSILDFKDSNLCRNKCKCNLTNDTNEIIIKSGLKPNINGPIKIGNSVIDAFKMEYYEGFPLDSVAWGQIQSATDWLKLMKLSRGYHNVIFNTTLVARDVLEQLIMFIRACFVVRNFPRVTLIMGHDANLYTVLNSLNFKPFVLPEQYETIPIGGKIVFQRWFDGKTKENLLKVEYVYQSMDQLRNGTVLNLESPPKFQLLELTGCKIDANGFCSWKDFDKIIRTY